MRNWLMQLPLAICKLDTREAAGGFSPSLRTENPGEAMLSPGAGGDRGLQLRQSGRERILLSSAFCSVQALVGLEDAHPHWGDDLLLLDHQSHVHLVQKHPHRQGQK